MSTTFTSQDIRERIVETERALREPGSVLFSQSRYEITRMLGEGGMGITFLADELCVNNLRRPLVLKFVKDSLDPNRLTRFLNEVQLSILFSHPNLVPVFRLESEVIRVEDERRGKKRSAARQGHTVYYAVMQYINGWNLRQIVNRLRSLNIVLNHDLTMFIISRIARGLHYVHEYRDENGEHLALAHRDVSPENILIDHFARVKVSDFGIAMATNKPTTDGFQQAGNLLYCAPEQLSNGQLDRRCDIYNIGLLMYLLFTDTDRFGVEARENSPRERIRKLMAKPPDADLTRRSPIGQDVHRLPQGRPGRAVPELRGSGQRYRYLLQGRPDIRHQRAAGGSACGPVQSPTALRLSPLRGHDRQRPAGATRLRSDRRGPRPRVGRPPLHDQAQ